MTQDDALTAMLKHSKTLPEGGYELWVEGCQLLAETIEAIAPKISDEQLAVLIGAGAMMSRQGFRELQASGMTEAFFKKP